MVGVSLAVIAVILVMAAMMVRSGWRTFAAFSLPLTSVPLFYLLSVLLGLSQYQFWFCTGGFLLAAALCLLLSRAFRSRRTRAGYLFFCLAFSAALFAAYLWQM